MPDSIHDNAHESLFRVVSIGYAAENKPLTTSELEIYPAELMPYAHGELTNDQTEIKDSGTDGFDQKYTVKVSTSNCIRAKWLQWGSNRVTAPDVRRGERVLIWQYADADVYYWTSCGLDDFLRRLETVVWAFSNTKDESVKQLNPTNSYFIEVNTHKKHLTIHTCKSDGEPFAYTIQLNTKEGVFTLADDDSNYIEFDSAERKITAKNKDGSFITIDKRVIRAFAPDLIHMKTKAIEAHCDTFLLNAASSITMNTKQTTLSSSASITMSTGAMTINAATLQGNIGATIFTGTVMVQALLTASGGFAAVPGGGGGAAATISIPMNVSKTITVSGADVIADGKSLKTHTHTGNLGAPTSAPN